MSGADNDPRLLLLPRPAAVATHPVHVDPDDDPRLLLAIPTRPRPDPDDDPRRLLPPSNNAEWPANVFKKRKRRRQQSKQEDEELSTAKAFLPNSDPMRERAAQLRDELSTGTGGFGDLTAREASLARTMLDYIDDRGGSRVVREGQQGRLRPRGRTQKQRTAKKFLQAKGVGPKPLLGVLNHVRTRRTRKDQHHAVVRPLAVALCAHFSEESPDARDLVKVQHT